MVGVKIIDGRVPVCFTNSLVFTCQSMGATNSVSIFHALFMQSYILRLLTTYEVALNYSFRLKSSTEKIQSIFDVFKT